MEPILAALAGAAPQVYRDRTALRRPALLGLANPVLLDLISFLPCEDVLKLRLASVEAKRFIEESIPFIYARMRRFNSIMPVIKFDERMPGETPVAQTLRAKHNLLLFRNECMLAKKSRALAAAANGAIPPYSPYSLFDTRPWQTRWWEYLVYLKNGLKHGEAQAAVALKLPLDEAKRLGALPNEHEKLEFMRDVTRRIDQEHEAETYGTKKSKFRGVAGSGTALNAYDPALTAGKILDYIRIEFMAPDELKEFLRRKGVAGPAAAAQDKLKAMATELIRNL
jgi:hypothetical protein